MRDLPLPPTPPDFDDRTPGAQVRGWMSRAELRWLHTAAAESESVVEIGSFCGRSSVALLTACRGDVYCVDPWDDEFGSVMAEFQKNVGHYMNLRTVRGRSPAVAAELPDVDMVFIDGDHEYESVRADIAGWLPKTRTLICGHDYGSWPGVARAVAEAFGDRVTLPADTIWAVAL